MMSFRSFVLSWVELVKAERAKIVDNSNYRKSNYLDVELRETTYRFPTDSLPNPLDSPYREGEALPELGGTTVGLRKNESRADGIARIATALYAKGSTLPDARRAVAKELGGLPSLYLGTVDPIYFRLAGLATPLPASAKKSPSALASAVRVRRDSGVRWETVAASAEATIGRRVSVAEAKTLYAKTGADLDSSYVGRGTRVAAPATYADLAAAPEAPTKKSARKTVAKKKTATVA